MRVIPAIPPVRVALIWSTRSWWRPPLNGVASHTVKNALGQVGRDHLGAHHQYVGVVVCPRDLGGEHAVAQRRAHAAHLVGRDLLAAPAATEDDTEVVAAVDDPSTDVGAQRRVVGDRARHRGLRDRRSGGRARSSHADRRDFIETALWSAAIAMRIWPVL